MYKFYFKRLEVFYVQILTIVYSNKYLNMKILFQKLSSFIFELWNDTPKAKRELSRSTISLTIHVWFLSFFDMNFKYMYIFYGYFIPCFLFARSPGSATDIKNGDLGSFDTLGDVIIMWDVILEGYRGVFNVMNCKGKGRFVLGLEGWFSEELPPPGCCSIETVSGLVADLRLGLKLEDGKAMVENISAGILSIISWRYLFVEDALRYLQHFLSS